MTDTPNPFQSPQSPQESPSRRFGATDAERSPSKYDRAIKFGIVLQVLLGLLMLLVLDGGRLAKVYVLALALQYAMLLVISVRRPETPTGWGLAATRFGVIAWFVGVLLAQEAFGQF